MIYIHTYIRAYVSAHTHTQACDVVVKALCSEVVVKALCSDVVVKALCGNVVLR